MRVGRDEQVVRAGRDRGAEQPPLRRVQVLGLVHQDVPVGRFLRLAEQVRRLAGQLQVSGLAGVGQFRGDPLGGLPHLAALGLGQRPSPAGAHAGQVRLLGAHVLGQEDLLPLVLAERRGKTQPGVRGGFGPPVQQHPLVRDDRSPAGLLDDAVGQPVDVEYLDLLAHLGVPDQQVELGAQRAGQVAVEGGDQHAPGPFGQEGRPVQHRHRLAGAGAAGHLGRAGVAGPVGDLALVRVQERAPRRERVSQDELQILRSGHEGDLAGGALHGGHQVVRVHLVRRRAPGGEPGRLGQRLVHRHAPGQRVQRGVLGLGQRLLERFQVGFPGQPPDRREDLRVHAEPGQFGVADVGEQLSSGGIGGWLQLLDGVLVADFQDPERPVDAEPAAGRVGVRLVLRQNRDQAVRVRGRPAFRDQDHGVPAAVHRQDADPVVPAVRRLLQLQPRLSVPGEPGDGHVDGALHIPVQLGVFSQEAFGDRQPSHRLCPPLPSRSLAGSVQKGHVRPSGTARDSERRIISAFPASCGAVRRNASRGPGTPAVPSHGGIHPAGP